MRVRNVAYRPRGGIGQAPVGHGRGGRGMPLTCRRDDGGIGGRTPVGHCRGLRRLGGFSRDCPGNECARHWPEGLPDVGSRRFGLAPSPPSPPPVGFGTRWTHGLAGCRRLALRACSIAAAGQTRHAMGLRSRRMQAAGASGSLHLRHRRRSGPARRPLPSIGATTPRAAASPGFPSRLAGYTCAGPAARKRS